MIERILVLALASLGILSCSADLATMAGAVIRCTQSAECPTGYECNENAGLCIPTDAERTPPTLVDPIINRTAAAAGIGVNLTFGVSEPLLTAPKVELVRDGAARIPFTVAADGDLRFAAVFAPQGGETEGDWAVVVSLIDQNGNEAPDLPASPLVLDFHAPIVVSLVADPPAVRAGGTLDIDIEVNEPLAEATVRLTDGTLLEASDNPAPLTYRFSLFADGSQPPGLMGIHLRMADPAGNLSEQERPNFVLFDYGAPTLERSDIFARRVRAGLVASVSLTFDELLSTSDPATLLMQRYDAGSLPVGAPIPLDLALANGTNYIFDHTVVASDEDGTYTLELASFRDVAGNEGAPATLGAIQIDNTPPVLSSVVVSGGRVSTVTDLQTFSAVSGVNDIQVTFDVDEDLTDNADPSDNGVLQVSLGSLSLSCGVYQASTPSYRCSKLIPATTSGRKTLEILARDVLGNANRYDEPLATDFDPPVLYAGGAGRALYKADDIPLYTFELDEPVDAADIQVFVTKNSAPVAGFFVTPPDLSLSRATLTFTGSHAMIPADEGIYGVSIVVVDDFGNRSAPLTDLTGGFQVDATKAITTPVSVLTNNPNDTSRAKSGETVTATFRSNEPLPTAPVVTLGGLPMTCGSATGTGPYTYACTRQVATISGDTSGQKTATVTATDAAGNVTVYDIGTVTLDFVAPAVALNSTTLTLVAPPGCLITSVTKMGINSHARVAFTVTEELLSDPAVTVSPATGTWIIAKQTSTPPQYIYDFTLTGGAPPQVTHAVQVSMNDRAGNPSGILTLSLPVPPFPSLTVDTVAPTPITAAQNDKIMLTRAPWGTSAGPEAYTVATIGGQTASAEAGSTVMIRDGATVATGAELGRGDVDASGVFSVSLIRSDRSIVYLWQIDGAGNADSATGAEIKTVEWIATMGRKVAGRTIENPSVYDSRPFFGANLVQAGEPGVAELNGNAGMSEIGTVVTAVGTGRWANRTFRATPDQRKNAAMAYDTARGRLVLFGGEYANVELGDTWEWDGSTWTQAAASGPAPRTNAAMAYDAARGEVVLFGGTNATGCVEGAGIYCDDTWAWDGAEWQTVATTGPTARAQHMMAYDPVRARVVLFGGLTPTYQSDTWEWNGTTWGSITAGTPTARASAAMAWDGSRNAVVLFGGRVGAGTCDGGATAYCSTTWSWNGATWTNLGTTGALTARVAPAMAYDAVRGRLVMFGGDAGTGNNCNEAETIVRNCGTTWELIGTTWTSVATVAAKDPVGRSDPAMVWDASVQKLLMFGGEVLGTPTPDCLEGAAGEAACGHTWLLDGTVWRRARLDQAPLGRSEPGLAYDPTNLYTLMFGGDIGVLGGNCNETGGAYCDYTWGWDGVGWQLLRTAGVAGTTPLGRVNPAMAFFNPGFANRIVMYGGERSSDCGEGSGNSYCTAAWLWCSTCASPYWFLSGATGGPPASRLQPTMAGAGTAATPSAAILFGGYNDTPGCAEPSADYRCGWTWRFGYSGGYVWTHPITTEPTGRAATAMAYDSVRFRTIMFGGEGASAAYLSDTREWNDTTSSWANPSNTGPSQRYASAMVYDASRRRAYMFGGETGSTSVGCDGSASDLCGALWEWDGATWTQRPLPGSPYRRKEHAMAYDSTRGRILLFGGAPGTFNCGEGAGSRCTYTWELNNGAAARPAQTMSVPFAASGETFQTVDIRSVTADFTAGGVGRAAATCTTDANGAVLYVWDKGAWRAIGGAAQNGSAPGVPTLLRYTTTADTDFNALAPSVFADRVQRLFRGRNELGLNFAVAPVQSNGCTNSYAQVGVDYAEVRVRYKRK
jgi:hypothetical protein